MRSVLSAVLAVDEAPNPWFSPSYVADNWSSILGYLGEHVRLTVSAVVIGAVIALPLALLARRSRWLAGPALGLSTGVYTIPVPALVRGPPPVQGADGHPRADRANRVLPGHL